MNSNRKRLGLYLPLLTLAIAVTVTLRSIACIIGFDFETGYFTNKQLISATVITLLASCFILGSYLLLGAPGKPKASFSTPATYIPTGVVCVSLVYLLFELVRDLTEGATGENGKISTGITLICAVLALLSIGHFFLNAFITERASEHRAYYSLATVCFLAFYAAKLYFDTATPINAPNKITDQMAFLFSALFFLYEARISLGRERWRGYVGFGLIAALLTAYSSVPSLITFFVTGNIISASVAESVTLLALCFFVTLRLITVERLTEDCPSEAVERLRNFAKARTELLNLSEKQESEEDEAQISIDELLIKKQTSEAEEDVEAAENKEAEAEETDCETAAENAEVSTSSEEQTETQSDKNEEDGEDNEENTCD